MSRSIRPTYVRSTPLAAAKSSRLAYSPDSSCSCQRYALARAETILDYGGNVMRHGPVDRLRSRQRSRGGGTAPVRTCPGCQALIAAAYTLCPHCGHKFTPEQRASHDASASTAGILSGQVTETEYVVEDVTYSVHRKRGADEDAPRSLRVDYRVGWRTRKSEWV